MTHPLSIYGTDSRKDLHQLTGTQSDLRDLSKSTCVIILKSDLDPVTDIPPNGLRYKGVQNVAPGTKGWKLKHQRKLTDFIRVMYPGFQLKQGQPFAGQTCAGIGSAWLIEYGLVITAGHCIYGNTPEDLAFVFDFALHDPNIQTIEYFTENQVYFGRKEIIDPQTGQPCQKMFARYSKYDEKSPYHCIGPYFETCRNQQGNITEKIGQDWAVVPLDRVPDGCYKPINLGMWWEKVPSKGTLMSNGYPSGLPAKFSSGASIKGGNKSYVFATLDILGGSSGSVALNETTKQVVGIVCRGPKNYKPDGKGSNQIVVNVLPSNATHKNHMTWIQRIDDIPIHAILQNQGYVDDYFLRVLGKPTTPIFVNYGNYKCIDLTKDFFFYNLGYQTYVSACGVDGDEEHVYTLLNDCGIKVTQYQGCERCYHDFSVTMEFREQKYMYCLNGELSFNVLPMWRNGDWEYQFRSLEKKLFWWPYKRSSGTSLCTRNFLSLMSGKGCGRVSPYSQGYLNYEHYSPGCQSTRFEIQQEMNS